jgi:hypothetical protein
MLTIRRHRRSMDGRHTYQLRASSTLYVRLYFFCQIAPRLRHAEQPRSVLVIPRSLRETKALGCIIAEFFY